MLWTLIGLLILFWILVLIFEIAGGLVHILLVIALIVFIFNVIPKEVSNIKTSNSLTNIYRSEALCIFLCYPVKKLFILEKKRNKKKFRYC